MSEGTLPQALNRPAMGVLFIVIAMVAISVNDVLIKMLSGGYPLHQIVFIRSGIGIVFTLMIVQYEGGFRILRTQTPWLQATRGMLIVLSNLTYFTALAVVPLAEATALFFIAPLMITLLSIPFLGERVGIYRLGAVVIGFVGMVFVLRPWESTAERGVALIILALPAISALTYAANQILTRKLGAVSKASALAFYIQGMFVLVSTAFYLVAGDGAYAVGLENESLLFLLRAWVWPEGTDWYLLIGLGVNSAVVGYGISQAYRMADASTVAPFEYVGLPLAIFWGWLFWGDSLGGSVVFGIALIMGSATCTGES